MQKARQEQDLVEAELRGQERHIQELKAEIERKEGTIHGLDLEVERLQQASLNKQQAGEPPVPGVVKQITLGRLTGGYRNNPKSRFDDSLQFLIEPRDADGHTIKVPGSLHLELFEFLPTGVKVPLSAWDISHRELRRSWDQPLFGGPAYRILIPFKALPANEKMRVLVRFTTLDGKLYEAERDFTIRLPGPGETPMLPMAPAPGGYSVVTPGHMINGTLVGPMATPPGANVQTPAPAILSEMGRVKEKTTDLPAPPMAPLPSSEKTSEPARSEPKAPDKKQETIPMIPIEPRKTPSTLESPGNEPPPLPAPPEIPKFSNAGKSMNYESLPSPSPTPRTAQPLYPKDNGQVQAGYTSPPEATLLSQPPPASWREKVTNQLVQVEYSSDQPIKLSRPIVIK